MDGKTHRIGPSIIQTQKDFASEEQCHAYLERARWPNGVHCLRCDGTKIVKFTAKGKPRFDRKTGQPILDKDGNQVNGPDRYLYQCQNPACKRYQFAATAGTLFSDTHLPLRVWMQAIALM